MTEHPPPTSGTEILWDNFGVPHIYAPDHPSLFYAYGYAQMEAHAELLVRLYVQARGCAAALYGETWLDSDRWVRTNGIPQLAREWAAGQSAEFVPLLDAFTTGLNTWASEHANELSDSARTALPLTVEDVLAHGMHVIHFGWLVTPDSIEMRVKGALAKPSGSNGWAIAPGKSASGRTMLMSNSHLQWGDNHTYFEVQLTAPGVTSYGAVWVGFPTLRLCFTEHIGWTQTTNSVALASLYHLSTVDEGYVLDGVTRSFEVEEQTIDVKEESGFVRREPHTVRRSKHGPVVFDDGEVTAALRVAGIRRPRMFEQFWQMGLSRNLDEFHDAMAIQHLPLFNTMYADREGHIMYLFNSVAPARREGDHEFWCGVVPGDDSRFIWPDEIVPYDSLPKVIDPPCGWVQNCNDSPWTCTFPMVIEPADYEPHIARSPLHSPRAQRSIRLLSATDDITLDDLRNMKLDTRCEFADHVLDDLISAARQLGNERAYRAANVLDQWDRQTEKESDGAYLFFRFVEAAGEHLLVAGGHAVAADASEPLTTPRGLAVPEQAVALLETIAAEIEAEYGTLHVLWGDVIRLRRGTLDLPGNGAPSALGAIRTSIPGIFEGGTAAITHGDTFYFVIEYSEPIRGYALCGYGNWSREGSKHGEDQLELASRKEMRPILRSRSEVEAALENRTCF